MILESIIFDGYIKMYIIICFIIMLQMNTEVIFNFYIEIY